MSTQELSSQESATQQLPPIETSDGLTYDDIQKACVKKPGLLEELVSRNFGMFESMMERSRKRRAMVDVMTLDPATFVRDEHTDKACYIFSEAIGSVFRDFVLSNPKRKELLVDTETREDAKDLLCRLHVFTTEFADFFQTAFDEAMQGYCENFKSSCVDKYFTIYNEETQDFETSVLAESQEESLNQEEQDSDEHASNAITTTPSKRPTVRLSSVEKNQSLDTSSDEEEEEDEDDEDEESDLELRRSGTGTDIEPDEGNNEEPMRTPSQARSTSKKRKFSSENSSARKKMGRGRPRKGPMMTLDQGMRVLAYNSESEEWSTFKIGPRASNTVITMTAAKKLLSAGNLKPAYVDI